jgi:hypothetical protein
MTDAYAAQLIQVLRQILAELHRIGSKVEEGSRR